MFKSSRRLLWLLCTALAVVSVGSASAQASVLHVNGERTTITPNAASNQFFAANEITVTGTGPASLGPNGSLILPITGGSVNTENMDGHVYHSGGVTFSHAGRSLNYRDFILVRDGGRSYLSALVNDRGRERFAWVDSFAVSAPVGNEVIVTGELKLSRSAAHQLNWLVGSEVAHATTEIGTLSSVIRIAP